MAKIKSNAEKIMEEIMDDSELSRMVEDPVTFSRAMLDKNPRWYQQKILEDGHNRKICRWGRRAGKTFSMVLHMIWYAFTHENSKQLVVGPYGIQVDEIFDELRALIRESSLLESSIARSVQSPQRLQFGNGAIILGLSAGTSSGKGGSSIRGQGADWVYLDEADYLNQDDINSIMGTQLEDMDNIGVWAVSTPTGARDIFWQWCIDASKQVSITDKDRFLNRGKKSPEKFEEVVKKDDGNGWIQYHYPSWVNPKWDDEMETELKALFSAQGYIHEVEAQFGDETTGVYNKDAIDDSKYSYTYKDMRNRKELPDTIRIIGVDWDKYGAATQIVVSEYDEEKRKIRVVERVEIPSTEFTFDNAIKKIIKLNQHWNPQYIYIDKGYGEYQAETLKKKIGKKKVKPIAFNSKLEVVDPTDKTVDKKEAKHFMVTQAAILLERGQLMLSKNDKLLYKQMESYRVVRKTTSGKPVYTSENEHAHDAFVLTILGFNQEYPEIAKLLEKRRKANISRKVKKKLQSVKEKIAFSKIRSETNSRRKDDDLKGEPDYVKHMKSIEYGKLEKIARREKSSIGARGTSNGPPGRTQL